MLLSAKSKLAAKTVKAIQSSAVKRVLAGHLCATIARGQKV
jgi:hypothetical protein